MVSFNKKNTGQGTLQGKDRDSSRSPCERIRVGREEPLYVVPCSAFLIAYWNLSERDFCGKSIPAGAPTKNSVRMQEATGAQGRCALHSSWCDECSEPHMCHHSLTVAGFWGCSGFALCFFPLLTHAAHRKGAAQIWIPHTRVVGLATPQWKE